MSLLDEINQKRKEIFTDSYPMSIGELSNMYRDGEIEINPEFQRFYRWTDNQKVRLIESILLGIPIPSIFVAQRDDGVWDLVDGLQRVSTILSFMGELRNTKNDIVTPLKLLRTEYLPSLENKEWNSDDVDKKLDDSLKRLFKREKIEIKIIKKESDSNTKFELFQRLNTGGSNLSDQEVRNCLLIMLNKDFYNLLVEFSANEDFKNTTCLTDRLYEERYEMELCLRVLAICLSSDEKLSSLEDVGEFLTESMRDMALLSSDELAQSFDLFKETYLYINQSLGDNAFKKYTSGVYKGGFSIAVFEVISTGVFNYLKNGGDKESLVDKIKSASESLEGNIIFRQYSGSGVRASYRIPRLIPLGKELIQ